MLRVREQHGRFVEVEAAGTLTRHDYEQLVPQLERIIDTEGKLRALIELDDFSGWDGGGLVEDLRFDLAHRRDFDRVAVIGDRRWQRWALRLAAPFFSGEVAFFERAHREAAEAWIRT